MLLLRREVFASLALRVSIFAVVSLLVTTVSQKCATSKLTLRVTKTLRFHQNWRCLTNQLTTRRTGMSILRMIKRRITFQRQTSP